MALLMPRWCIGVRYVRMNTIQNSVQIVADQWSSFQQSQVRQQKPWLVRGGRQSRPERNSMTLFKKRAIRKAVKNMCDAINSQTPSDIVCGVGWRLP